MSMQSATRSGNKPLESGDWRRRLLRHHLPLALASAVVLVLFMTLSPFDANKFPMGDLFTGSLPQDFPAEQSGAGPGGAGHTGPPQGGDHQIPPEKLQQIPRGHSGDQAAIVDQRSSDSFLGLNTRRFTYASGYVATGILALTLLIGPGKLLLRRRNPVSDYLTRDVGTWAAIASVVHVLFGLEVHASITDPLPMFIQDGSPLTISFGLANWTGLAATVIVVGLLAISNDFALRKLKARSWKNLQRLNYALIALVIAHAFFYGVLLRTDSPYTMLLFVSVVAVFVGQRWGSGCGGGDTLTHQTAGVRSSRRVLKSCQSSGPTKDSS